MKCHTLGIRWYRIIRGNPRRSTWTNLIQINPSPGDKDLFLNSPLSEPVGRKSRPPTSPLLVAGRRITGDVPLISELLRWLEATVRHRRRMMNFAIFNFRSPVASCYSVFCHRTRLINSMKHQSHSGHVTGLFGQHTLPLTDSLSFSSELDFGFLFSSLFLGYRTFCNTRQCNTELILMRFMTAGWLLHSRI